MREVIFIEQNQDRWSSFEAILDGKKKVSPDEIANYYILITDDLAYAQTFYPNSKLVKYLNHLASKAHLLIYRNKREEKSRIFDFWKVEVPQAVWEGRRTLMWALIIFLVAIGIGLFSNLLDDSFVRQILGDDYVNMTLQNIENGDPMAVYKSESVSMFFMIGSNNVRVMFYAFVTGVLGSIVTAYILLTNGIMVGTFLHFFIKKSIFGLAFSTIFIHGALELSAIVIAGGAGMIMGNSLLFPGTYKRLDSLKIASKRSLKIIIGLVPFVVFAALLESFVTKHYLEIGALGRWSIIILSFGFIIWYFIIYPRKLFSSEKL